MGWSVVGWSGLVRDIEWGGLGWVVVGWVGWGGVGWGGVGWGRVEWGGVGWGWGMVVYYGILANTYCYCRGGF